MLRTDLDAIFTDMEALSHLLTEQISRFKQGFLGSKALGGGEGRLGAQFVGDAKAVKDENRNEGHA